jgi:hypothetical protein
MIKTVNVLYAIENDGRNTRRKPGGKECYGFLSTISRTRMSPMKNLMIY